MFLRPNNKTRRKKAFRRIKLITLRKQGFPPLSAAASLVGSATPHADARHVAVFPRHTHNGCPLCVCRSSQFAAKIPPSRFVCHTHLGKGGKDSPEVNGGAYKCVGNSCAARGTWFLKSRKIPVAQDGNFCEPFYITTISFCSNSALYSRGNTSSVISTSMSSRWAKV